MQLRKALSIGLPLCVVLACGLLPAGAEGSETVSTNVNIYPKTVANFKDQIGLLARQGLLSPNKTEEFKTRLDGLERLMKNVEAKEWPQSAVSDLDKKFASFNADLTTASQTKTPPVARRSGSTAGASAPSDDSLVTTKKKDKKRPTGDDKPGRIDAPFENVAPPASQSAAGDNDGAKVLPDFRRNRRPNVGGGDSKPTGAAGRNE